MPFEPFDYLLIGGGLQNALIALAVLERQPNARVCLVEQGASVGGNHLWCFHAFDLTEAGKALVEPIVVRQWPGYSVRFPSFGRRLAAPYAAVSSDRLAEHVRRVFELHPQCELLLGHSAVRVQAERVTLKDGRELLGRVVIDARGPEAHSNAHVVGYQKFLGVELELDLPTTLTEPIVMDATVRQEDGFRFVYVLPLGPNRVLVEDTYFSDGPELNLALMRARALSYASDLGLSVERIAREESAALPLPAGAAPPSAGSPLLAGYAGGWFHPTTGYSFPVAARLALHIASTTPETLFNEPFQALVREHARQLRYAFMLNRLLFQAVSEDARRNVLERFYKLPEPTIARFYALSTTGLDRARILCGRPPRGLSLSRAITKGLFQ